MSERQPQSLVMMKPELYGLRHRQKRGTERLVSIQFVYLDAFLKYIHIQLHQTKLFILVPGSSFSKFRQLRNWRKRERGGRGRSVRRTELRKDIARQTLTLWPASAPRQEFDLARNRSCTDISLSVFCCLYSISCFVLFCFYDVFF